MIDLGYMAKRIVERPDWLGVPNVRDIYAVANCISDDFCDYINYWKHNGFWFFDSVASLRAVASEPDVDLASTKLVYYRGYPRQYDAGRGEWAEYSADRDFSTNVAPPVSASILGYDVVTYSMQNAPECSPLSCNHVATEVNVNEHCLIDSLDYAIDRLQNGMFDNAEPGPCRIIAIYAVEWPKYG